MALLYLSSSAILVASFAVYILFCIMRFQNESIFLSTIKRKRHSASSFLWKMSALQGKKQSNALHFFFKVLNYSHEISIIGG